jgi:hypothetical protein
MVIDKPDKDFWSNDNLFCAFNACLTRLYTSVLNTDLYDTFDNRLKLLSLVPEDPKIATFFNGELRDKIDEDKAKAGENCWKFLKLKEFAVITDILKEVTRGLQNSVVNGPSFVIEFLEFSVFNDCLIRLYTSVLNTDLYDKFDNRLELLSSVPDDPQIETFFNGKLRAKIDEDKAKAGETCRKFLKLKDFAAITGILKEVTRGLQNSVVNGPSFVIEFLQTRVFRLKQFHKLWSKVELSILDNLTKDPDKSKMELESVVGSGGFFQVRVGQYSRYGRFEVLI